jgi:hypothetical protein
MSKSAPAAKPFSLKDFKVSKDMQLSIPIRVPNNEPLMIHQKNMESDIAVAFYENRWHLVDPDLIKANIYIPYRYIADLYEGVVQNGKPFLLMITHCNNADFESWQDSLELLVAAGRKKWVCVEKNDKEKYYEIVSQTRAVPAPAWSGLSIDELVNNAFGSRTISWDHPLARKGPREVLDHDCVED